MCESDVWEGIALDVLGETGCDDPPVDAYELAECCGFEVVETVKQGARIVGDCIEVDGRAREVRRHGLIAHEVGHWSLERAREPNTEDGARYMAGALMLPRKHFWQDMSATGWDLRALKAKHLNASGEMIARRIVALSDGVASIWDQGKMKRRVVSPWRGDLLRKTPTRLEKRLAEACYDAGDTQHPADLVWAWPLFDGSRRRVIVVVEAEQLALRWE